MGECKHSDWELGREGRKSIGECVDGRCHTLNEELCVERAVERSGEERRGVEGSGGARKDDERLCRCLETTGDMK